jgi:hypothetical protein
MEHPIPATGRTTFLIHTIVAVAVGLPLLAARGPRAIQTLVFAFSAGSRCQHMPRSDDHE